MKVESFINKKPSEGILHRRFLDISRAINGSIEFGSPQNGPVNMQGFWLDTVTPGVADTEFIVNHNLQYIPTGIIVISVDKAAIVYASQKNLWTKTQIRLKCNVATVSLQGFVV
jgi:hypothetical protein